MRIDSFLKLVEIRTKIASMVPLMLGTVYAIYRFDTFNIKNFALLFISLLSFDMVTTAVNNYFDYKRAAKKQGYNYEEHNAIVRDKLGEPLVIMVILLLSCIAVLFGILLYINTNIIVLLVGVLSFAVGIAYSFGPLPISRMPLGEVVSGFFMGFVIVFLSVFVHIYDRDIVLFALEGQSILLRLNAVEVLSIFAFSIPAVCGIANIMLANNICDMEDDIENGRYTLPIYIGKQKALWLFEALYYIAFIDIILLVIFRIVPLTLLLVLLVFVPIKKNIGLFRKTQTKKDTFELAVKNFIIMCGSQLLLLAVSTIGFFVNLL
ncbi:1,4-dihydroxy-2-naphthoate polyprenyltransferase [Acetivibrio mesophilus]|uniref:1,4-dihydroxy-2-naphthoate polyprenyltransferase n=1 Tax=Acetivibrio mesophilus TaxID=2487273 RepID=A0A4Q0I410_9FIRM|nr:1,4-dihydroxy-2-naphthoate polyprenyltransferase [Acetivibrio mesophilus]RXE59024.1 1,4-dihydroxy-2-naphthoate polyprenyltransferase [Acetivibrio mesophilus]